MYKAISKFCKDESLSNGLMLIDMPTGSGKTHQCLDFIFDEVMDISNRNKKYFFITSVKNNLPYDKLKERFRSAGILDQFYEKVVFIDSNMDSVLNNYTPALKKDIPDDIKKDPCCNRFIKELEYIQVLRNKKTDPSVRGLVESTLATAENEFRKVTEPTFHNFIQRKLYHAYRDDVSSRIAAIKRDRDWRWVGRLYPTVFTSERQVYFMSMDKFLSGNVTIVDFPYTICTSDLVKNAVVIIDEFDATKETILKNIIRSNLYNRVEYLGMFRAINNALHPSAGKFPALLTRDSNSQKKNGKNSLQTIIDSLQNKATQLFNDYSFEYEFRTLYENGEESRNFMFQDHSFFSVFGGQKSYISYEINDTEMQNFIKLASAPPEKRELNIQNMLGSLNGYITYFQNGVAILARNYKKHKESDHHHEEFSLESAIKTVLSLFYLEPSYKDYLTQQILLSPYGRNNQNNDFTFDLQFYERGFRFYSFEDDERHDLQSTIMVSSYDNTPEKILVRLCNDAKVIGISATASVASVIGNYDLEYIESKLGERFKRLSEGDRLRLEDSFRESMSGYKDIDIKVSLLGSRVTDSYSKESWLNVYQDLELACHVFDLIERELPGAEYNYHKERYVRIALAYKEFMQHDDIRSFLCVLTKHPKPDDPFLNLNILHEIFGFVGEEIDDSFNTKASVCLLDSVGFNDKKEDIISRLANGEKLFVISVYQTIGAGQNLQYPIPKDIEGTLVSTNHWPSRGEKDFDAIYLDKPTNLLVNLTDNLEGEDFVKYLFYTEYLQEAGEITKEEARQYVGAAFRCFYFGKKQYIQTKHDPYDSKSVIACCTRIIIQAVGRICRTNQKNRTVYIYADSRISDFIDVSVCEGRSLNPEFLALLDAVKNYGRKELVDNSLEAKAALLSVRVNKEIHRMLEEKWTEISIFRWHILRDLCLRTPTLSQEEVLRNIVARNFFVRLPQKSNHLYYSQEHDYSSIKVGFEKTGELPLSVSAAAAKLDRFMTVPILKYLFEENGWATEFVPNEYILSPTYFNNIYKGALGEVIGKFLFKELLQIELEEIQDPELFEKFDFKISGEPIYVDFKNWHESAQWTDDEILHHIQQKAIDCGCRCAFIVNILAEDKWRVRTINCGDLRVVVIPSLLLEGEPITINERALTEIRRCINEYSSI